MTAHRTLPRRTIVSTLLAASLAWSPTPAAAAAAPSPFALRDGDRVVFYGDSITQDGAYARFVEEYVRTRFPQWNVRFYNAGVGGDTVRGGGSGPIDVRLARDVIALKPTVVTIMLGMNDGGYKRFDPTTLSAFADGYRAIVERLQRELPGVRLTLIRPSPFDDVARPPQFAPGYDDTLRRLGCYVVTLAATAKADVADFRDRVNAGLAAVVKDNPELAKQIIPDRVHPGPSGHVLMGATLLRTWHAPGLVSRVAIDAAGPVVASAEKAAVTGLAAAGGGLAWTQTDESLPLPLNYDDAGVDLAQKAGADLESLDEQKVTVTGLAPGRYELKVDGQPVATFAAEELARGVNLARYNTPMRWQAYSVAWSTGDGHDLQRLRRRLLVAAERDPSLAATADALAARDELDQKARSEQAIPKPRKVELVPVR
jgi:lysophospholipase L1-like esterase